MNKYKELAQKVGTARTMFGSEVAYQKHMAALAELLERELAPLVEAAKNFLAEIDRKGAAYDPTMRHLREKGLRSALKGWER